MHRLEEWARSVLRDGSKSFSFGAWFFSRDRRLAASLLYVWCRSCDDAVDGIDPSLPEEEIRSTQRARIDALKTNTQSCFRPPIKGEMEFEALAYLVKHYGIPEHYPMELIEGLRMDSESQTYETLDDLALYCYRVAGVVGLMMTHVMGASDERALAYACSMGSAMQLTNIARDVLDDDRMGRCYLPKSWLAEKGILSKDVASPQNRLKVYEVVDRLLGEADRWYAQGRKGLHDLPLRSAWAIAIASRVYQRIGKVIRSRRGHAWDTRAYVPFGWKLYEALRGTRDLLPVIWARLGKPFHAITLKQVWTFASDPDRR